MPESNGDQIALATKFLNGSQLPIDDQNETFWMPLGRHDNFGHNQIAKKSPKKKKKKNVKTLKKIIYFASNPGGS